MTSSSSSPLERGLDTMLLVYSLLQGHPASQACEQFLRNNSGWFTTCLTILEAKAVLTKIYLVDPALASQKLLQFASGPCAIVGVDKHSVLSALQLADRLSIGLNDAVLLQAAQLCGARFVATEDQQFAQACISIGLTPDSPFDAAMRAQTSAWEAANLAPKGLPRVLRRIHQWLSQAHAPTAQAFWSQTGAGSHLP